MNLLKQIVADISTCYQSGKYPIDTNDNKIHVLYLGFYLNGTGIYRALLPALEMNRTTTHAAIVNHLEPFSHQKQSSGFPVNINDDLIQWADHIVFATAFHNLTETINILREVNKKPNLKFYLDIDDNYHTDMPGQDINYVTKQRQKLITNMNACNTVICENKNLLKFYTPLLKSGVAIVPNLLSDDCYTGIEIKPRTSDKFRIGLILNPTQFRDVYPIRKQLIQLGKNPNYELIVFGWNGKIAGYGTVSDALKGVNYQWVKPVEVTDYFETLANLHLDIAIMPLLDNEFNRCKSYHKLLQYSQAGVLAICSDVEPYTNIIFTFVGLPDNRQLIHSTADNEHIYDVVTGCYRMKDEDKITFEATKNFNKKSIKENCIWHTNQPILTNLFN